MEADELRAELTLHVSQLVFLLAMPFTISFSRVVQSEKVSESAGRSRTSPRPWYSSLAS